MTGTQKQVEEQNFNFLAGLEELKQVNPQNNPDLEFLPSLLPELTLGEAKAMMEAITEDGRFPKLKARRNEEDALLKKMSALQKKILIRLYQWLTHGRINCPYSSIMFHTRHADTTSEKSHTVAFSKAVKRLELRGFVSRHPPERAEYIRFTALGLRVARRVIFLMTLEALGIPD